MNAKIHCFYYNWYANPEIDGRYFHWNHNILPHLTDKNWNKLLPYKGRDDIGANYYPKLGCYSSNDELTIHQHFKWMRDAGIGVAVITWLGGDSFEDKTFHKYLNISLEYGVKIAIHIEPHFKNCDEFKDRLKTIVDKHGNHPSLYRVNGKIMYYVYDSYRLKAYEWASIFAKDSKISVRGTDLDGIFIGHWVFEKDDELLLNGCFDGFYTYFASEGFTFGSTISNWFKMSKFAKKHNMLFIPSVGPGYIDTRIRPWNVINNKSREDGIYYDRMFFAALSVKPDYISITSFNEWHEGTQIEPAIPSDIPTYTYENYGELDPEFYLKRTKFWSDRLV